MAARDAARVGSASESAESSDSDYEYYHAEIFVQLPSVQALHPGQNPQPEGEAGPARGADGAQASRRPKDKEAEPPLKNMAMCIQAKRGIRSRRNTEISDIGYWESWRRSKSTSRRKVGGQMRGALTYLLPWQHTLHSIKGRFGVGVKSYFVFLRYLVFLNLLHSALICGFILGPSIAYGGNRKPLTFGKNDSYLDFLMGTGYLERSLVFFGFYTRGSLDHPCLNLPLLYLVGILSILLFSLLLVARRTIIGYKHTWMLRRRYSMNVSYKIFCGWDFTIHNPKSASLKRGCISKDLKLLLEEQRFSQRVAQRSLWQKLRLYLLRFVLNVLVLSLLGGAFALIYFAINKGVIVSDLHPLLNLVLEYLPPLAITFVNLVLPEIFRKIAYFEDYSFTMQVNATLVRSIFLKLASLGIYFFSIFTAKHRNCRENQLGREMYKLSIFNFLATFCNVFLFVYPRKILQETFPSSALLKRCGKQRFLIPFNILDLVYGQTVSWMGVFYCPLLPLIGTVTLMATFYIKKLMVQRCCEPEQRMFRASNSSVLFHFMLLLGLTMAAVSLGFNAYLEQPDPPQCGMFENGTTVSNITAVCVASLPGPAQSALSYLTSEAFAVPLLLAEFVVLTSYLSRGRANQKTIERLKDMLVTSSLDKQFLVKKHTTMVKQ